MKNYIASESVTEGHPDKVCDQISDAVLDAVLTKDPNGRVACEVMITKGIVIVAGEISTKCYVDIPEIVNRTLEEIGYNPNEFGIMNSIQRQSSDIALGVDKGGAGDQGIMYGYATNETPSLMPLPIYLAHKLTEKLTEVRRNYTLKFLKPDGKSQVTVEYENGIPKRISNIVVSSHHSRMNIENLREKIKKEVIDPCLKDYNTEDTEIFINPTGNFEIGGPTADTGLTGRKIIVDTYGGVGRHGGGAFSGKDPSKVDRSAAYMARHIAKSIVASKIANRCEVQLAYAIGIDEPVNIAIDTFKSSNYSTSSLINLIKNNFDLTPKGIIEYLNLKLPIYKATASYGHFGRDIFSWEKIKQLKK